MTRGNRRILVTLLIAVAAVVGVLALAEAEAVTGLDDGCPTRPLPPPAADACRGCPTYVDPVVCTVVCAGGTREKTFTNQCFANCSGYIIRGECQRTGG